MTIVQCDLCGRQIEKGRALCVVWISEYLAEVCDPCAKGLINWIKTSPWSLVEEVKERV